AAELLALRAVPTVEVAFARLAQVRSGPAALPYVRVDQALQALALRVAARRGPVAPVAHSGPAVARVVLVARVVAPVVVVAPVAVVVPVVGSAQVAVVAQVEMVIVEATDVVRRERPRALDQGRQRRQ